MSTDRVLMPSHHFLVKLQALQLPSLRELAAATWHWIGFRHLLVGAYGLCMPCGRCLLSVRLQVLRYRTRTMERPFLIGQCSKCSTVYWGLAQRHAKRIGS